MSATLHSVIEDIKSLPSDDKLYLKEIIDKISVEVRRDQIYNTAIEAKKSYESGKTKSGNMQDLLNDLND